MNIDRCEYVLKLFEIDSDDYEGFTPKPCHVCGCRSAVYTKLLNVCACTNPACENSLFGERGNHLYWRTNPLKAIGDWHEYIEKKASGEDVK